MRNLNPARKFAAFSFFLVAALFAWSWQQWVAMETDAGNNFYLYWRLASGEALYRDLFYGHGPLSPWLTSLLFRLHGSILGVALWGALFTWLIANLVYRLFDWLFDRATSVLASVLFLVMFGFSQYVMNSNYNYVAPYKPEATHGILLGLLLLYAGKQVLDGAGRKWAALFGLFTGMSLLTSSEIVFANGLAALVVVALRPREFLRPGLATWALGAFLLPPALAALALATYLPPLEALANTFRAVVIPLTRPEISHNLFFQFSSGLHEWRQNLAGLLQVGAVSALLFAALAAADTLGNSHRKVRDSCALALVLLGLAVEGFFPGYLRLWSAQKLLVFGVIGGAIWFAWRLKKEEWNARVVVFGAFVAWAFAYLLKIALFPRVYHYGFFLGMPAALLLVACLTYGIPQALSRLKAGAGGGFRIVAIGLIGLGMLYFFRISNAVYQEKTFHVGFGGDTIAALDPKQYPPSAVYWLALDWVEKNVPPSSTLLTLPEGTILNYLSRRLRPGPYTFNPVEAQLVGEERFLEVWRENPPEFIALVHNEHSEFGFAPFGTSDAYGKATMAWVKAHYQEVKLIGKQPFTSPVMQDFGILFLRRR